MEMPSLGLKLTLSTLLSLALSKNQFGVPPVSSPGVKLWGTEA